MKTDILPDPVNKINDAGEEDTSGNAGPGFAKVKFGSDYQTQVSRTISGRGITASPGYHQWNFSINYNPLTREEFEPVASFLEGRQGRLKPFYVILPQHNAPRDSTFADYCASNTISVSGNTVAGSNTVRFVGLTSSSGRPKPGDFFTITDNNDSLHKKAYKVIYVEEVSGDNTKCDVTVVPPVTRGITTGATVNFLNPKFRVIQKGDTFEYDLDTDGLYQFSLSLEEILP